MKAEYLEYPWKKDLDPLKETIKTNEDQIAYFEDRLNVAFQRIEDLELQLRGARDTAEEAISKAKDAYRRAEDYGWQIDDLRRKVK
jgi:chromosome segregation ATPase